MLGFRNHVLRSSSKQRMGLTWPVSPTVLTTSRRSTRNSSSSSTAGRCPSCKAPLPTALPVCPACSYISLIPDSTPYPSLFRLPETYRIDVKDLKRRFLEGQRLVHPDAWSSREEEKKTIASAQSSTINKAYQTLLSPLKRANYLLELQNMPLEESDTMDDNDFMMDIMEAFEEVQLAESHEDFAAIREKNQSRIDETIEEIAQAFEKEDYPTAKKLTVKLRYFTRIEEQATEKLRDGPPLST